ncbi:MAG: SpoIVB peptidase [Eubacteriaceae bacterium]|nr:SpoIVB peptidase [Eubacteriaceae bacterium]
MFIDRRLKRIIAIALVAVAMWIGLNIATRPGHINILVGKQATLNLNSIWANTLASFSPSDLEISIEQNRQVKLLSGKVGSYKMACSLLGFKIREWTVNALPSTYVYPGGELIGVKISSKGIIAYNYENIDGTILSPARKANIRLGDVIQKVNGVSADNADDFIELVNQACNSGGFVKLTVLRNGNLIDALVVPEFSERNQCYQIGLNVKESIAGIGTLTYVTADKSYFGALGHAIAETTTGTTVPIGSGMLNGAQIVSLLKGEKNEPGAIHGLILKQAIFGQVIANNEFGIFGSYNGGLFNNAKEPVAVALQNEVKEGPATILTTIDGEEPKEYEILITRLHRQSAPNTKSMTIEVTDPELLSKTGGIIQGMSGSPILQNGKIIGAVTHVLVNDPKSGYGVYIEWMLQNNMHLIYN